MRFQVHRPRQIRRPGTQPAGGLCPWARPLIVLKQSAGTFKRNRQPGKSADPSPSLLSRPKTPTAASGPIPAGCGCRLFPVKYLKDQGEGLAFGDGGSVGGGDGEQAAGDGGDHLLETVVGLDIGDRRTGFHRGSDGRGG